MEQKSMVDKIKEANAQVNQITDDDAFSKCLAAVNPWVTEFLETMTFDTQVDEFDEDDDMLWEEYKRKCASYAHYNGRIPLDVAQAISDAILEKNVRAEFMAFVAENRAILEGIAVDVPDVGADEPGQLRRRR